MNLLSIPDEDIQIQLKLSSFAAHWCIHFLPFQLWVFVLFFKQVAVLPHWDFSNGKFGLLSLGKASCDRIVLPNIEHMLGILVFPLSTEL